MIKTIYNYFASWSDCRGKVRYVFYYLLIYIASWQNPIQAVSYFPNWTACSSVQNIINWYSNLKNSLTAKKVTRSPILPVWLSSEVTDRQLYRPYMSSHMKDTLLSFWIIISGDNSLFYFQTIMCHTMKFSKLPWNSTNIPWDFNGLHGFPWSFHGTPRKSLWFPWNPMELHGASMKLHGIPWSFHGTPWGFHRIPWNSMKLHGILWNSMEFHGIPWSYFTRDSCV